MSQKKSNKLELLVRVRYSNPLPAPPCPPKLLEIPTNPRRYAEPKFVDALANDTPFPMIVDAECGMPLDLGKWESLWEPDADDSALNPNPDTVPPMDPRDAFLFGDLSAPSASSYTPNASGSGLSNLLPSHVLWLRKTEYISSGREGGMQRNSTSEKPLVHTAIDVSRAAQIRDIETSFAACNEATLGIEASQALDLKTLRHPNKPNVTAVDSFEVFPDADIWANAYDLFRFSERPGERPIDQEDPRLDCAILRPMESDGDHFLAYYLTKEDEDATAFKHTRFNPPEGQPGVSNATSFSFVRDYETVKIEQEVPNEFLLVMDEGDTEPYNHPTNGRVPMQRGKGAYYKNIERKMILKKKRVNVQDGQYLDKWEKIHVSHAAMSLEEEEEREDALAEVLDPMFLMTGAMDAEGEVDETMKDATV